MLSSSYLKVWFQHAWPLTQFDCAGISRQVGLQHCAIGVASPLQLISKGVAGRVILRVGCELLLTVRSRELHVIILCVVLCVVQTVGGCRGREEALYVNEQESIVWDRDTDDVYEDHHYDYNEDGSDDDSKWRERINMVQTVHSRREQL